MHDFLFGLLNFAKFRRVLWGVHDCDARSASSGERVAHTRFVHPKGFKPWALIHTRSPAITVPLTHSSARTNESASSWLVSPVVTLATPALIACVLLESLWLELP